MDIHIGAFMRTTYVRLEGCPCSGYIMEACIETLTWAYTEGHFGEPRMCLERVVLAVGICMEACIETHTWAYTPGIFENHVFAFGQGCPSSGHMYGSMY